MSFTSYLIRKFDYSHENLFFRVFSEKLENNYNSIEGEHILIGNISINGHQIDAIYIANGQITIIDFKDYGGKLTFSENNPWKMKISSGKTIFVQGGARSRNPFQQVRAYRFTLAEILEFNQGEILENTSRSIKWIHTKCIVLFQQEIEFDINEIPKRLRIYFDVCDKSNILNTLDDYYSSDLQLSDNEIRSILKTLDIREDNLLTNFVFENEEITTNNEESIKLSLIKKLISSNANDSFFSRILNYYKTLIDVERYKEPESSNLKNFPYDPSQAPEDYKINITSSSDFHNLYLSNLNERFPKNIFIGLNILIGDNIHPLLHTIILASDLDNNDYLTMNLNSFELHNKTLKNLNLGEDIIEDLHDAINFYDNLEDKLNCLRDHLDVITEMTSSLSVGFSTESLYTVQLASELNKISKLDETKIKNQIFKSFVFNKPINFRLHNLDIEPYFQITKLNLSQRKAINIAFKQPLTVITGPPGTGKTQVVVNILANSILKGHKTLFASKNNKAVDNVKDKLDQLLNEPYVLRFGTKNQINNNVKPQINKFINLNNQEKYTDKEELLKSKLKTGNDDIVRIDDLVSKINQIPYIDKELEEFKASLKEQEDKKDHWSSEILPKYRELFLEKEIKIKADINELNLLLHKINKWQNSVFGKYLFDWFHKANFQKKVKSLNDIQHQQIYEILEEKTPWIKPDLSILISAKDNLNSILDLKKESKRISDENRSHIKIIEEIKKKVENLESILMKINNEKPNYINEIKEWGEYLPKKGVEILDLSINQKLFNLSGGNATQYLEYIPAKNIWKNREINDFTYSTNEFLNNFNAICLTNLSIKNSFPLNEDIFDLLVIDEASQCDIASAIPLIYRAKRVIVIGDPLQLTHITSVKKYEADYIVERLDLESNKLNYVEKSLYDFCFDLSVKSTLQSVFLDEHYRCHPEIINFSNNHFYRRILGQEMTIRTNDSQFKYGDKGISWIDVLGEMHNRRNLNMAEVNKCIDLIIKLNREYPEASIGVITPFRDQYKEIFKKLPEESRENVKVDTVHKFQGDEKDIIIFSTVVTDNSPNGKAFFINRNAYLINVAITRAKSSLYIVGNHEYCKNLKDGRVHTPLSSLANYVEELN